MGKSFAAVHELVTNASDDEQYGLIKVVIDGLRAGRYIVDGIPIDQSPASLFNGGKQVLTHAYAFRLVNVNPPDYCLSFSCFDDDGSDLGIFDFGVLFNAVHNYLVDGDEEVIPGTTVNAPIEGGFLLYAPDPTDLEAKPEVIVVYPPNMNSAAYRSALIGSLVQGIEEGFGCGTE